MANTYTLIASNTLTSSAASVTFSAIPNTYTDLVLRCSIRDGWSSGSNPNAFQTTFLTFNGSSSAQYSRRVLYGDGSTAYSDNGSGNTSLYLQYSDSDGATANTFSNGELYIPNYTSSTNKPTSWFNAHENNATAAYINAHANLWSNTSAITSLTITNGAGQLVSGSSFFLYGIKNS